MRIMWSKVERGWYMLVGDDVRVIGVCLERDGKWHVYQTRELPPGDAVFRTMAEAREDAERRIKAL